MEGKLDISQIKNQENNSTKTPYIKPYTVTIEMLQSLQSELSPASPTEHQKVKALADEILAILSDLLKPYMAEKLQSVSSMSERILVIDSEDIPAFLKTWVNIDVSRRFNGGCLTIGNFIFVKKPEQFWTSLPDVVRKQAIINYGSEKAALEKVGNVELMGTLAHEIAHQFEAKDANGDLVLPYEFDEAGANYYRKLVEEKLGIQPVKSKKRDTEAAIYTQLLAEYGDDVHKVFFGNEITDTRKNEIIESCNQLYHPLEQAA